MKTHVLICTHNGEKYIFDQLQSIADQSITVNCIHIVDYNSSDNTVNEIKRFIQKRHENNRILILLNEEHRAEGVNKSFISALRNVSTYINSDDILYICDQDDVWISNKNEHILSVINRADQGIPILVHHDVIVADENLNVIRNSYYGREQKRLLESKINHCSVFGTVIGHTICVNYSAVNVLSRLEYSGTILMYDWYWGAITEKIGKRIFVENTLSIYRQHDKNIIGAIKKNKKNIFQAISGVMGLAKKIALQQKKINSDVCYANALSRRDDSISGKIAFENDLSIVFEIILPSIRTLNLKSIILGALVAYYAGILKFANIIKPSHAKSFLR